MFDCIIVGAGPAGSSSAYHLAKQGHSVLVLDKADFPRTKSCGGGVSPAIAEWFDLDFSPVVQNHVSEVKYTFKMGDPAEVQLKGRDSNVDGTARAVRQFFNRTSYR